MDISFIDRNSSYIYQDFGLYEVSATGWIANFFDPATWIVIFSSGHNMNFFFIGSFEG